MIILIFVTILLCVIPGVIGANHTLHKPGAWTDADFFYLAQNSAMQLLGVFSTTFFMYHDVAPTFETRLLTWICLVASGVCAVVAIPLYLKEPTEYSACVAFAGGVSQGIMVVVSLFPSGKMKTE